jgi:hypothetical protein
MLQLVPLFFRRFHSVTLGDIFIVGVQCNCYIDRFSCSCRLLGSGLFSSFKPLIFEALPLSGS